MLGLNTSRLQKTGLGLKRWLQQDYRMLLTAGSVTSVVLFLRWILLLQSWELAIYDQLFRLRPLEAPDNRLLVITVGEAELKKYSWPLSDEVFAELLEKIQAKQPSAVGLDFLRDRPKPPGTERLNAILDKMPNFIGIEVLSPDPRLSLKASEELYASKRVGFNNMTLDPDGVVRRGLLFWRVEEQTHFSFGFKLANIYLEQKKIISKPYNPKQPYLQFEQAIFRNFRDANSLYGSSLQGPYQLLNNFRDPRLIKTVTMTEVMNDKIDPNLIRDRVVVIGSKAAILKDLFYFPYNTGILGNQSQISGVELHANYISEILSATLDGRPLLRTWPYVIDALWIFLWSLVGSAVIWRLRSPIRGGLMIILSIGAIGLTGYGLFLIGWVIPIAPPVLSLLGSAIVLTSYLAHQEQELQRSRQFFHSIIDTIPDPVFVKDESYTLMIVNDAFCQLIGSPPEDLIGKTDYDVFTTEEANIFRAQDNLVLQSSHSQENEEQFTNHNGNVFTMATKRSLHKDVAGNLFLVGVIRDITERKRIEADLRRTAEELTRTNDELKKSERQLRYLANHDPLTGLPNRKLFYESLNQLIEWGEDNNQLVGLLFLDLDGFKPVNDTLGHDMGDILLKAVAQRIKNCLRASDIVSRLGGDEFTVILPGIKQAWDSTIVADKILKTISAPYMLQDHSIRVTVSIGISVYPLDGDNQTELIKQADLSMYEAKRSGRNQYQTTEKLVEFKQEAIAET